MSTFTWAIYEVDDSSEKPVQNGGEVCLEDAEIGVDASYDTLWQVDEADASTGLCFSNGGVVAPLSTVTNTQSNIDRGISFIKNEPRKFLAIALDCIFGVSTFVSGLICISAFANQKLTGIQLASSLVGLTFLLAASSTAVHGKLGFLSYVSAVSKVLHILKSADRKLSEAAFANDNSSHH